MPAGQVVSRWVVGCAVAGTVLIGVGAFWLSFTALADLATRSGVSAGLSWVWPLLVDGVIVVSTISVVALSGHGRQAVRYPWLLLAGGAGLSVSANITHALVAAETQVPGLLAALVASVPPVVLLAITHLTVELARYRRSIPASESAVRAQTRVGVVCEPTRQGRSTVRAITARPATVRQKEAAITGGSRTRAAVATVARLHAEGVSNRQIAAQVGVHPSTVGRWLATSTAATGPRNEAESGQGVVEGER